MFEYFVIVSLDVERIFRRIAESKVCGHSLYAVYDKNTFLWIKNRDLSLHIVVHYTSIYNIYIYI